MESHDLISNVAIGIICVIIAAVIVVVVFFLVRWIKRVGEEHRLNDGHGNSEGDAVSFFRHPLGWFHAAGEAADNDDDMDPDELTAPVMRILTILPQDVVLVSDTGEVLRSNPSVYRLGIVKNEAIVNDEVKKAVAAAFATGEPQKVDIVTLTDSAFSDEMFRPAEGIAVHVAASSTSGAAEGANEDVSGVETVSRRNWLTLDVGLMTSSIALVLIDDVSAQKRFARIRDAFITNVTDELVKPTRALEKLGEELSNEKLDETVLRAEAKEVQEHSTNLEHLVSDLLLLLKAQQYASGADDGDDGDGSERSESGKVRRPTVSAQEAVTEVLASITASGSQAQLKRIHFIPRFEQDSLIAIPPDQLKGALRKLVENAIDYSPQDSSIGIWTGRDARGQNAIIRVIDHGIGIAKADQPHVFERFWRGKEQKNRTSHGTGLGLAIVKHVALTYGGSVGLWSAKGQGSTFSLILPIAREVHD
jgi:signal transduction histidine kinase